MHAVQVLTYGGPDQLTVCETTVPEPGAGFVRVRLSYAGVNFTDIYTRQGTYRNSHTYKNVLPFTLGMEGMGHVDRLGPGVTGFEPGERVAYCLSLGSYAQFAVVPAWRLVKVPDTISDEAATTLMLQGCTAHYLSHSAFTLQAGHTCLIHAGAGGVGQLLIQLAKSKGATVLTTVGSAAKAELAANLGADLTIIYTRHDVAEAVRTATAGAGVEVVYDSVGLATFAGSLASLKRRGTLVLFGGSSGAVASVEPLQLAEAGSVFLTRPHMADYMADAAEIAWRAGEMLSLLERGAINVNIDRVFDLADVSAAHRTMEERRTTGKLLLRIP